MKCDRCGREATIEEVTKVGQTYVYKHLCESCAAGEGLSGSGQAPPTAAVITVKAKASSQAAQGCPHCGMSFAQFRETGRLGCPGCYEAFEERLGPMIERAQEGGTHHIGKTPKRLLASVQGEGPERIRAIERVLGESKQRQEKLEQLGRQLESALAGERFEQAAMIRDEMRRLRQSIDQPAGNRGGDAEGGRGDH